MEPEANSGEVVTYHNNNPEIQSDGEEVDISKIIHPGYRFCPTDEVLVGFYLKGKISNQWIPKNRVFDVKLYQFNPEELSGQYKKEGEKECYFFTPRDRKYKNGSRPNRAAGDGYWKATGADKHVRDAKNKLLGYRKALVFYRGKPPKGDKTNWIMHEFRVSEPPPRSRKGADDMTLDDWVLCRIYEKVDKGGNKNRPRNDHEQEQEQEIEEAEFVQEHDMKPDLADYGGIDVAEPMDEYNYSFADYHPDLPYLINPPPPPLQMDNQLQDPQCYFNDFGTRSRQPPPAMDLRSIFTSRYSTRYPDDYMGFR
ncbi:hypothetical protein FNV43_RR02955 [Rhamnella rubrinervis]|uniref:NAC domain-containing protein n=1 Tax=Rhamnella rubrinervis TaxID=2594499 RepID=A0A8K0HGU6_9ROSA|nr:hypothetical protein FNV43_RR02955 [Rhamnella rubrinervis]